MARRSKEDAEQTRNLLLDVAEAMFQQRGTASTSLVAVARAAGVSRGAIYWHFRDKADLLEAMCNRVSDPMKNYVERAVDGHLDAMGLRRDLLEMVEKTMLDVNGRRVFTIMLFKTEYVQELESLRARHRASVTQFEKRLESDLRCAARNARHSRLQQDAVVAARGLCCMLTGLFKHWLFMEERFDLLETGRAMLDAYLAGLGLLSSGDATEPAQRNAKRRIAHP